MKERWRWSPVPGAPPRRSAGLREDLRRRHIDEDDVQTVVQNFIEHASLYLRPERHIRGAHNANLSHHIVKPAQKTELFLDVQLSDVFEDQRCGAARKGKVKRLSGPPFYDGTSEIQAKHVDHDAGCVGVSNDQHVRVRHRTDLKISAGGGPDDSSFSSNQRRRGG